MIGQYDSLQTVADGRTKVRVYTPWGQREQGRFALEVKEHSKMTSRQEGQVEGG